MMLNWPKSLKVLEVSVEAIKGFSEEGVINYFTNFYDNSQGTGVNHGHCNFNPLDEMMRLVEENRKLYERLLESEREKISYLKNDKTDSLGNIE